jgi:hypothetical protein
VTSPPEAYTTAEPAQDFQNPPADVDAIFSEGHAIHLPSQPSAAWNVNANLSEQEQARVNHVVHANKSAFILSPDDMGVTHVTAFSIDTGSTAPIKQRPYRVNPAQEKLMRAEVDKLVDAKLVEPCNSLWASPVILVSKKGDPLHKDNNQQSGSSGCALT